MNDAAAALGLPLPSSSADKAVLRDILRLLECPPAQAHRWIGRDAEEIVVRAQLAVRAKARFERMRQLQQELPFDWDAPAAGLPWEAMLQRWRPNRGSIFRWLDPAARADRRLRRSLLKGRAMEDGRWVRVLESAAELARLQRWFESHGPSFLDRFESAYEQERTDWGRLCAALEWVQRLLELLEARTLPGPIAGYVRDPAARAPLIRAALARLDVELGPA